MTDTDEVLPLEKQAPALPEEIEDRRPRYQVTHFPGFGCWFEVVNEHSRHTLAHPLSHRDWSMSQCREFARRAGFTEEHTFWDDGLAVFHWYTSGQPSRSLTRQDTAHDSRRPVHRPSHNSGG